jgi:hypothetical protein
MQRRLGRYSHIPHCCQHAVAGNEVVGGAGVIGGHALGVGIYVEDATAVINNSFVRAIKATGGDGVTDGQGVGDGISIDADAVSIQHTIVIDNVASTSGDDVFGHFSA